MMKLLVLTLVFFSSLASFAGDEFFQDFMVQTPSINAPSRGTLKGDFADVSDRALTPRTGSFSISLPLSFPGERGAMQSPYKVDYSPGYGISEYGVGWSARLKVHRFTETGKIKYDASDDLITPFGQFVAGNDGYYYSKDIKDQMRALNDGDELRIFLKDGTVVTFGSFTDGIYTEKNQNGDVHTWFMRESVDQVGKTTRCEYQSFEQDGRAYLTRILYGGLGTDFQYQVDFSFEKNQRPYISHHLGSKQLASYRVSSISVKSKEASVFQERYKDDLVYTLGDESPAFYLKSMARTFSDGSILPAVTFDYDVPKDYLTTANWQRETSLDGLATQYKGILTFSSQTSTPDFNNDGRPDLEIGTGYERYLQTDAGYQSYSLTAPSGQVSNRCLFPVPSMRRPRQFFQPLGPATEQLVYARYAVGNKSYLEYCHANGELIDTIELPQFWDDSKTTIFSDINDDTLPDLVHLRGNVIQVAYNTSSGGVVSFDPPTPEVPINLPFGFHGFWIKDMNGDANADLVLKGDFSLFVHYGDAQGNFATDFEIFSFYLPNGARIVRDLKDGQILFADMNKDGLPDILLQGDGYISMYINTGDSLIQLYVPGLFASPQFFRNIVVSDIAGKGIQQIATSIRQGGEDFIATLDLDRASLGMLNKMDDGQGNVIEFTFAKAAAQEGVQGRQTITTSLRSTATGEKDFNRDVSYGEIATHSLTGAFLAFKTVDSIVPSRGQVTKVYQYGLRNLPKLISTTTFDFLRPDVRKVSTNIWEDRFTAGIQFPQITSTTMGYTNAAGSLVADYTETKSYGALNICPATVTKTGSGLTLTTTNSYFNLAGFSDHLDCLTQTVDMVGSGANAWENFTHKLSLARDSEGRVTQVDIGLAPVTTLQQITYGINERVETITRPGRGITTVNYDPQYRVTQIINPDGVENKVMGFEFVNDQPLQTQLIRGTLSFDNFFRYDGYGRLVKQWDNTGTYSEANPKMEYNYIFGSTNFPGKAFENMASELSDGVFDSYETLHLSTAKGKTLATIIETATSLKVAGLTDHNSQFGESTVHRDHVIAAATDLNNLKYEDLDFINNPRIGFSKKDFFGAAFNDISAKQVGVEQEFDHDQVITSDLISILSKENNDSNLVTEKRSNGYGQMITYLDEDANQYSYAYDPLNRLRKITFPSGETQTITYDDNLGKVTQVVRDNIGTYQYSYDAVTTLPTSKSVLSSTGVLETTEDMLYDSIGRLTKKTLTQYNPDTTVKETIVYDYTYDGTNLDPADQPGNLGFLTEVAGPTFTKTWIYRVDEKVLTEKVLAHNDYEVGMDYTYYSQREPRSMSVYANKISTSTSIANYTFDYTYDRYGNMATAKLAGAPFANFSYNDFSEVSLVDIVGHKILNFTYDTTTREARDYLELDGSTTLMSQLITYNNRGFITNSNFDLNGQLVNDVHTYKPTGWLDTFNRTNNQGAAQSLAYDYDTFGLMTQVTRDSVIEPHIQTPSAWTIAGTSYGLDNLGRVTSRGTKTFAYGPNRRIQEVKDGATVLSNHFYDEENNPITKTYPNGNKEVYFHDMVLAGDHLYYPLTLGTRSIGYLKDNTYTRTSQNHLNTHIVDEADVTKLSTPFGERQTPRTEVSNVLDFTLKGYDAEIEAVRMGRRFYDPKAKRFLAADSYFLGNPDELIKSPIEGNLYSYALNNPITNIDPTGNGTEQFAQEMWIKEVKAENLGGAKDAKGQADLATANELEKIHDENAIGAISNLAGIGVSKALSKIALQVEKVRKAIKIIRKGPKDLSKKSNIIAGPGAKSELRDAKIASKKLGGKPENAQKVRGHSETLSDGSKIEGRFYRDASNGKTVVEKIKIVKPPTKK